MKKNKIISLKKDVFYTAKIEEIELPNSVSILDNGEIVELGVEWDTTDFKRSPNDKLCFYGELLKESDYEKYNISRDEIFIEFYVLEYELKLINGGKEYEISKYFEKITNVNIPETYNGIPITKIGDGLFDINRAVNRIMIPKTITSIGYSAFSGCKALCEIYYDGTLEDWFDIDTKDIFGNSVGYGRGLCVDFYFKQCGEYKKIIDINIPNTFDYIKNYQFASWGIERIYIPGSVQKIGVGAFSGCACLKDIIIDDGVKKIESSAFFYCESLKNITLPSTITEIKDVIYRTYSYNVEDSPSERTIENVYFHGTFDQWCKIDFDCGYEISSNITGWAKKIFMLNEENEYYEIKEIQLPPNIIEIGIGQFSGFNMRNLIIPKSVKVIKEEAFYKCKNLENLIIEGEKIEIKTAAFALCESLKSFNVSQLHNFEIEKTATYFENKNKNFAKKEVYIHSNAFDHCDKLKEIIIYAEKIGVKDYAFYRCANLDRVIFLSPNIGVGSSVFNEGNFKEVVGDYSMVLEIFKRTDICIDVLYLFQSLGYINYECTVEDVKLLFERTQRIYTLEHNNIFKLANNVDE